MSTIGDVRIHDRRGRACALSELTVLFDLCLVVVDAANPRPLTLLRPVLERLYRTLSGSDCTLGVLVAGTDIARGASLVGDMASQVAIFADPDASTVTALGISATPALVWVTTEPAVAAVIEGWDPAAWREVLGRLARKLAWTRPLVPAPGDPEPFPAVPLRNAHRSRPLDPTTPSVLQDNDAPTAA